MPDRPVIVITGTSKGIGRGLAEHYASHGWQVVGCSRSEFGAEIDGYQHFCLDVADEIAVRRMFGSVRKTYGRLDALVNNAGVASMNHSLLTPMSTVSRVLETNVAGTFLFCREAARLMQTRRYGRIVNFSTVAVPLNLAGESVYAASKAAIVSLTKTLARELGDFGITVNAVGPNPIRTDLIRGVAEEKIEALIDRQPLKRFGELADVIHVLDFFLSPDSGFITGQVIYLGGVS